MGRGVAVTNREHVASSDAARSAARASDVASTTRTDAVSSGIVKRSADQTRESLGAKKGARIAHPGQKQATKDAAAASATQSKSRLHKATAAYAAGQATASMADGADGSDDDGSIAVADIRRNPAARTGSGAKAASDAAGSPATEKARTAAHKQASAANSKGKAGKAAKAEKERRKAKAAKTRMQSRRTWLKARSAQAAQQ